jgi:hypothetical protein
MIVSGLWRDHRTTKLHYVPHILSLAETMSARGPFQAGTPGGGASPHPMQGASLRRASIGV